MCEEALPIGSIAPAHSSPPWLSHISNLQFSAHVILSERSSPAILFSESSLLHLLALLHFSYYHLINITYCLSSPT